MRFTPSRILVAVSVVVFVLAAFTIEVGDDVALVPLGLAFLAGGHLVR